MSARTVLFGLLVVGLLALQCFTALADGALRGLNQARLRALLDEGMGRAEAMRRLLERPRRLTATNLAYNTLALAALSALAAWAALRAADPGGAGSALTALGILGLSLAVIVVCQLVPRTLASSHPEKTAVRIGRPLAALYAVAAPLRWLVGRLPGGAVRALGDRSPPTAGAWTEEDLRMLVAAGSQDGALEPEEREMIRGVLRLGEATAHEVMTPRPDMVAASADLTPTQALDLALRAGHSRLPVYEENVDNVRGVLYTKDLMRAAISPQRRPLLQLARPPHFVPETKRLGELLHELRRNKVHLAIVLDEYGGTAGLVTIEDLLEEIVGEIQDEHDRELPDVEVLGPEEWVVRARADLDDVSELLGVSLSSEDYDTLGGFITARLERLPEEGDEIEVEGVRMRVLDTERRRIGRVLVRRAPAAAERHIES